MAPGFGRAGSVLDPSFLLEILWMNCFQLLPWGFVPGAADRALAGWCHLAKDALLSDFSLLLRLLLPDTSSPTQKCFLPYKGWRGTHLAEEQEAQIKITLAPRTVLLFFTWLIAVF